MMSSILKHMSVALASALALAWTCSVWAETPFTFTFNAGAAMDSDRITGGTIPDSVSPLAFSKAAAIKTSTYYTAYFVTGKSLRDAGYPGMTATAIGGASDVQNWVKGTSGTDEFTTRMSVVMKDAIYVVQDARSEITDNFTVVVDKDKYTTTMPAADEALFVVLAYHNPDYADQYGIIVARILPTAWNGQSSCTIWSAGSEFSGTYAGRTGTPSAVETYAVTLNKNDGTCEDLTCYTNGVVTTLPVATRAGYDFGGWFTNETFAGEAWTEIGAEEKGDKAFWAKWNAAIQVDKAQQRYPWNGKFDITYTVGGVDEACEAQFKNGSLKVFAVEQTTHVTNVAEAAYLSGDMALTDGSHSFVWDMGGQGGVFEDLYSTNLEIFVSVEAKTPEGVQLWEGGPYWAESNVGTMTAEGYGYYFNWGGTEGYVRNSANNGWVSAKDGTELSGGFKSANCPTYGKSTAELQEDGYIDSTGNLVAAYDAATAYLGGPWRMPTKVELDALVQKCTVSWISTNGVWGRLVKGKEEGYTSTCIFLPAGGISSGTSLTGASTGGYYWSSTPYETAYITYKASNLRLHSGYFQVEYHNVYEGLPVRPIRAQDSAIVAATLCTGSKAGISADLRTGVRPITDEFGVLPITYSASNWGETAADTATVTLEETGATLVDAATDDGTVVWTDIQNGTNTLTHTACGVTLTAQFEYWVTTYAVTLHKDGGTCEDLTNYIAGVVTTLPTATKTDCGFGGWFTNALFAGTAWTAIGAKDEGDKEFWAKWLVQTPQAVKDDKNQDVTVSVSEAWMASNNVEKANLDTDGLNGIKIWKSYVLGLDPNDANSTTVVTPVQTTDTANLTINLGSSFKPQTDAGVDVRYRLDTSDGSTWTKGADVQESPSFTTALPLSGVKYYKIVTRFYKK